MTPKELGEHGEAIARKMLLEKDYEILDFNWKFGKIELDIIAKSDDKIIFVEVKTRENNYAGEPWEAVTRGKQSRIIKAADAYLVEKEIDHESRFDIVSIIYNSKYTIIEHIEDAFYPLV